MKEITEKEKKDIQLEILNAVNRFCNVNNITYFLAYGTLLGAVRHKGYIPWDDDIDIMMLRKDYLEFIHKFNITSEDYKVFAPEINVNFPYAFAKVMDTKRTVFIENTGIKYPIGVNIDLFPFDNIPDRESAEKIANSLEFICKILQIKRIGKKQRNISKTIKIKVLKAFASLIPTSYCIQKVSTSALIYSNCDTEYLTCISEYMRERTIIEKSWLFDSVLLEFEGQLFPAPSMYDNVLQKWYGDYMTPPPLDQQITHHGYKAYWKC